MNTEDIVVLLFLAALAFQPTRAVLKYVLMFVLVMLGLRTRESW